MSQDEMISTLEYRSFNHCYSHHYNGKSTAKQFAQISNVPRIQPRWIRLFHVRDRICDSNIVDVQGQWQKRRLFDTAQKPSERRIKGLHSHIP
jgi:hypothetical protein